MKKIMTVRGKPWKVSYSQLSMVSKKEGCRRKWWFKYVAKVPEIQKKGAAFGTNMHAGIQHYLQDGEMVKEPGRIKDLLQLAIDREYLPTPEQYQEAQKQSPPTIGVEQRFAIDITPEDETRAAVQIVGSIDLLGFMKYDFGGAIFVTDHKSMKNTRFMKTEDQLKHDWQTAIYLKAAQELSGWSTPADVLTVRHLAYMSEGPLQIHEIGPVSLSWDEVNNSWGEAQEEVFSIWDLASEETVDKIEGNRARCDDFGGCPFKDVCHGTLVVPKPVDVLGFLSRPKELPVSDTLVNESKVQRLLRLQAERAAAGGGLNPPQETLNNATTPTTTVTRPDVQEVLNEQASRAALEYTLMNRLGYKAAEVERMSVENLQQVVDANLHRNDASILPSGKVVRPASMKEKAEETMSVPCGIPGCTTKHVRADETVHHLGDAREVTNVSGAEIPAGTPVQEVAPNEVVPAVVTPEKTRTRRPKNWKLLLVDSGAFTMEQVEGMSLDQMETECNLRRDGTTPAPARTIVVNRDEPNQTADDQVLLRLRTRIQELEGQLEDKSAEIQRYEVLVGSEREDKKKLQARLEEEIVERTLAGEPDSSFTLYLDCFPLDGKAKDLAEHLRPLMERYEQGKKVEHYSLVEYNAGIKFLAAAMFSDEGRIPDGGEFYVIGYPDWRDGVVGALSRDPRCRIVKGVK